MEFYRVQCADESLSTLLNPARPDGWVASDESLETQPRGIPACSSLHDLARYVSLYGLSIQEGDKLVVITGSLSSDDDRDQWAVRCIAERAEVIGSASAWWQAAEFMAEELVCECAEEGEDYCDYHQGLCSLSTESQEWIEKMEE